MNKFLILFLLFTPFCQVIGQDGTDNYDGTIYLQGLSLYTTNIQHATSVLGEPDLVSTEYWEMMNSEAEVLIYDDVNKLFFVENQDGTSMLESFTLLSPNFSVSLGDTQIRVGFNINILSNAFPISYQNKESGQVAITLGAGDYDFLLITYNNESAITSIEHRFF